MAYRGRRNFQSVKRENNKSAIDIESVSPVMKAFQIYSMELDSKHDKHERLTKASRDITIESKRIIFLLHSIDSKKNDNKIAVFEEAEKRINKLCTSNFEFIAKELKGRDQYQFIRAISAGIQEFIEAYTFFEYLQEKELSDWESIGNRLRFIDENDQSLEYQLNIIPPEYILGLADLTGEVMRNCINSLGSSNIEGCFKTCKFLQNIFGKYLTIIVPNRGRDFSQKLSTMRTSVLKCEHVCYNLMVRGTEGSKLITYEAVENDADEGFY